MSCWSFSFLGYEDISFAKIWNLIMFLGLLATVLECTYNLQEHTYLSAPALGPDDSIFLFFIKAYGASSLGVAPLNPPLVT